MVSEMWREQVDDFAVASSLYPVDQIGGTVGAILRLNPMTPIIDGYRSLLLRGALPSALPFLSAALVAFMTLAIGWYVFHRAEYRFAEEI